MYSLTIWFVTEQNTLDYVVLHSPSAVEAFRKTHPLSHTDINKAADILREMGR